MKKWYTIALATMVLLTLTACNTPENKTESGAVDQTTVQENTDYINLSVEAAQSLAQKNNVPFRLVEIDGEPQMMTMDYRPGRINATVNEGVVTSYQVEGQESSADQYDANSWKTMIAPSCQAFFDGCNNCRRAGNTDLAACTRKACMEYQKPVCLDESSFFTP